jgi:dipeptidyl aminopeptidase/acylaminoacyl peptidase
MTKRRWLHSLTIVALLSLSTGWCVAQETIAQPATIKAEGIPPIPATIMQDLERYSNTRTAGLVEWHPVKREMLISTRFGNAAQLHRVAMPGGARQQVTFLNEPVAGGSFEPTAGRYLLYLRDVGGTERYQIFRQSLEDGRSTMLTDGKSRNSGPRWTKDGSRIAFTSTRRNGRDTDIYIMDPRDAASARLIHEVDGGGWNVRDWAPDGKRLLVGRYTSINESALYLLDVESRAIIPLAGEGERAAYASAVFTHDGKGLYLTTNRDSEFRQIAYMDLATRKLRMLRPEIRWDVDSLALSKDGAYLAYVVNEDGIDRLHVMETANLREVPLPALPAGVMGGVEWHNNSRELGFALSHARSPSDAYSIDVKTRKLERWTLSETGGLDPERFSEPELVRWKSFDGLPISGFLYRPPPAFQGPRPVVISIHGGPESQSRPGFRGVFNYWLNEMGVAILYPNVRGSSGYGKTFLDLDNGMKREDSVKDIGSLLDWIATRRDLDKDRVMVTGGSYGGYMTLATMVHYANRIRCAVDVVGISNFVTFMKNTESYRRDLRRAEYGDERDPAMRDFFETIAPANYPEKFTKPILIVQGKNDPRVPVTESEQMVAAIRNKGGTVWYLEAADEGHGFRKKSNSDYQFAATVLFMQQFLLEGGAAH